MGYDLVVRGGRLVLPSGVISATLGVTGGRIAAIAEGLLDGDEVIDAAGRVVLPGAVDLHVHFNDPGRTHWEGWGPGSRAAAAGGVTTVVEMPLNCLPPVTTVDALQAKLAAAAGQSMVDYALWGGLITDNRDHLTALAGAGVIGFKAFMSHSSTEEFTHVEDGVLFDGLQRLAALGRFLAVHAESNAITQDRTRRLQASGRRDRRAWGEARPPVAELEAIHRALFLARQAGCRLHIVHMSLPEGAELIGAARAAGQAVTVETCAHYLALTEEDFVRLGPVAKCAPPLRDAARQQGLWEAVAAGKIDCITSDHSPCPVEDKTRGADDVWQAWGGITGVQTLLPLMLTEGHHRRHLSLEQLAALLSANPARIAGLWPRKGAIQVGADADLVLVDLDRRWRVEAAWLQSRHRQSPFVGRELQGWVERVLVRGRTVVRDGAVTGAPAGQWLHAGPSSPHGAT
ncbi:MAG: allantoinase AllB [Armatimonadota bacterium]|nr:allantoinase AllB [Armatimonadota bacterium]MDR7485931.1 allantoinase AllB [Armatimonadota bacterium]MDR7533118.1 allantoinase AllB [Armatimonadota bacterium]MDR7536636.1 allantoinase AllB [Armatimonadota bacterium]